MLTSCNFTQPPQLSYFEGAAQGTAYHITLQLPDRLTYKEIDKNIQAVLFKIDRAMSGYRTDSEISYLNRAPINQWLLLSSQLFDILGLSLFLNEHSLGYFDVTVGEAVEAYGFGPQSNNKQEIILPTVDEVKTLLQHIDAKAIQLHAKEKKVLKTKPVKIDLNAIAQGYTVDKIVERLESMGVTVYLVELGGEVRASAYKKKTANEIEYWTIAIEAPAEETKQVQKLLTLSGKSVATSGSYRHFREKDHLKWSHIINPHNAQPVASGLVSVTVVHDQAALADGWCTALMAAGLEDGKKIAEANHLAAYWISEKKGRFETIQTDLFKEFVK